MGVISDVVTGIFDSLGIKDWADETFKGGTIVMVDTSVSRMYKPSLLMDPMRQTIIQASISKKSLADEIKLLLTKNNNNKAIKDAWEYALGEYNKDELTNYYETVKQNSWGYASQIVQYNAAVTSILESSGYIDKSKEYAQQQVLLGTFNTRVNTDYVDRMDAYNAYVAAYPVPAAPSAGATTAELDAYSAAIDARTSAIAANLEASLSAHATFKTNLRISLGIKSDEVLTQLEADVDAVEAQLAGYTKPEHQAIYRPDTFYYGIPLLETNITNPGVAGKLVAFPVIPIKELGQYIDGTTSTQAIDCSAPQGALQKAICELMSGIPLDDPAVDVVLTDKHKSILKLGKILGYDLTSIIASVKEQDTTGTIKTVGIVQGVDLKTNTEIGKEYIFKLFETIGECGVMMIEDPYYVQRVAEGNAGLDGGGEESLECVHYDSSGDGMYCIKYKIPEVVDPYHIKTEEGYLNIILKFDFITKSEVSSVNILGQDLPKGKYRVIKVVSDNTSEPNRNFNLKVQKGLGSGRAEEYFVSNLLSMSYIDEGAGVAVDFQELVDMNFDDDSTPYLIPLYKGVYDQLKPMTKHGLVRECGHIVVFSGDHKNLTWAETNAGLIQFIMIVIAIITMQPYLIEMGFAMAGYAAFWTMAEIAIAIGLTVVGMMIIKYVVQMLFPNDVFAQVVVATIAAYAIGLVEIPTTFADPVLADKLLMAVSSVSRVTSDVVSSYTEVKSREYAESLDELQAIYDEARAKVTELQIDDPTGLVTLNAVNYNRRYRVTSPESSSMFYARTLNTDPGSSIGLNLNAKLNTDLSYQLMT